MTAENEPQRGAADADSFRTLLESTRQPGSAEVGGQEPVPGTTADHHGSPAEYGEYGEYGEYEGGDGLQGMPFTVGDLAEKGRVPPRTTVGGGPSHVNSTLELPERGNQAAVSARHEDHMVHSRFSIKRYRGYFDVTTEEVGSRIRRSLLFWKNDFLDRLNDNPDLYGPFWIASTLVFVSAAAANTAGYIAHHRESSGDYWYYDVDKVFGSMAIFFGYVGGAGLVLWAAMKYFFRGTGAPSLATIWCIYGTFKDLSLTRTSVCGSLALTRPRVRLAGYALSVFVPISVACVVPSNAARWAFVMSATTLSAVFLVQSLKVFMVNSEMDGGKSAPLLALVAAAHAGLGLALKFVFFDY